jgi:hypothetical protein
MATVYSDAATSGVMPDHALAGVVLCRSGNYTATADLAAGTVIQMVPIPKDAIILDIAVTLFNNACDGHINVGDGSSNNRFIDTCPMCYHTYRLVGQLDAAGLGVEKNHQYKYTAQDTIDIVTETSDLASGAILRLDVYYKMAGSITDET